MKKSRQLGAVCTAIYVFSNAALAASFTPLGDLPGGGFSSGALGISDDGSVVVGWSESASGSEAFRWTSGGGMVGLGDLPGGDFFSHAHGVSADGSVIVGEGLSASGEEAFRWTSSGGMVGLGSLPGGGISSRASGVSADGSVVVGYSSSASGDEAFRWTSSGGMVGLHDLTGGYFFSRAYGVSADGSAVVGEGSSALGEEAFRWTSSGGMVGLGSFIGGEFFSRANGVSADGSVVVGQGSAASGDEAFRWTSGGGMVGLGYLAGGDPFSRANGVSADGSVVVGFAISASGNEAFRWTSENGMQSVASILTTAGVDLAGWTLLSASGVSADGNTIVGDGINPDGLAEAWVANLSDAPLPTTPVDISGTVKDTNDVDICAMVLASGQHMFSCNPVGVFLLSGLPREDDGTVKRQIFADGFLPKINTLTDSSNDAVVMTRSGTCPDHNTPYDPGFYPKSAGKWIYVSGSVKVGENGDPVCAMVLANGQHIYSCDDLGSYALNIPLDSNGQFKLQVFADGFAPMIQNFDEFRTMNDIRMTRAVEC